MTDTNETTQNDQNSESVPAQNADTQNKVDTSDSLLDLETKDNGQKGMPGEKPEWLSDDLWDAEKKTYKADEMAERLRTSDKQVKDLREKMGRRGAPPATPDDYKVDIPDDAPWKDALPGDDPVLDAARKAAHKLGLSQGQFGPFVKEVMDALHTHGQKQAEENAKEPTEEEKAAARDAEIARIGPNGPAVVKAVSEFVRQNAGVHFDAETMNMVKIVASTAEGIKFLNAIREMVGGDRVPMSSMDAMAISGLPSDAEIRAVIGSKEYMGGDPATIQKVEGWLALRERAGRSVYLGA